jgi:tetratricopeptide (TPR) repeat protein
MALGELSYRANDLPGASEAFRAAHTVSPADPRAAYNLGTVLLALGRNEEAIEVLRPLAEGTEPRDDAVFNLAEAYRASGSLPAARDLLRSLVARKPSFPGASFALGMTLESLEDLEGAAEAYRAAIEHKPDDLASFLNLASVLERLGRTADARGILERALALPMEDEQARAIREAIQALSSSP